MKEVNSALNVDDGLKNGHKSPKNEEVIKYQSGNETIIQPLAVKEPGKNYAGLLYLLGGVVIGLAVALTLILPGRLQSVKARLNEESRSVGEQLDKKNAELTDMQKQLDALTAKNADLEFRTGGLCRYRRDAPDGGGSSECGIYLSGYPG